MRLVNFKFLCFVISYIGELTVSSSNKYSRFAEKGTKHDNPHWNYLNTPRIHFKGVFKADVPTINNRPKNFDIENYIEHDEYLEMWNPRGTGEFSVHGTVLQVCYYNGTCAVDSHLDPVVGAEFADSGTKVSAKMVDLDPDAQIQSEVFGWKIKVGDFFTADYIPAPLQFLTTKIADKTVRGDEGSGAAFQSVLTNIKWGNDRNSSFIEELKKLLINEDNLDGERLSIRFNVDLMDDNHYGRIVGAIGAMGKKASPVYNRRFVSTSTSTQSQLTDAPFTVDTRRKKVTFDFANTFQMDRNGSFSVNKMDVYVAVSLDHESITCGSKLMWLGKVKFYEPTWYSKSSGIQSFPDLGMLSDDEMDTVNKHALGVFQVEGIWPDIKCKKVLISESKHGIDIRPFSKWTDRRNPPEQQTFKVFATRFGKPLPNTKVIFEQVCSDERNCFPAIPFTKRGTTDEDGIATFTAWTRDPGTPRKFIDGQMYRWLYWVEGYKPDIQKLIKENRGRRYQNNCLILRVFSHFVAHSPPTWLDDIYPIFKQYAVLYPAMTENFLDMGNYYDVIEKKTAIIMTMTLPMTDPNYMPVTRDLSESKRKAILEWLSSEKPFIGRPRNFYSLENLRKQLQTALQLELSTIPPYITAFASIKHGYNSDVKNIIKTILIQEMNHMTLVANVLNAVGGRPVLHHKKITPIYPSRLPGGVQPDLVVPIEKLSIDLIRNVFMTIEEPEVSVHKYFHFKHTFDFVKKTSELNRTKRMKRDLDLAPDAGVDQEFFPCLHPNAQRMLDMDLTSVPRSDHFSTYGLNVKKRQSAFQRISKNVEMRHNTIGGFYLHILNMLCYLTHCGLNNSIFTGDPARQVEYKHGSMHGETFSVTDFHSAVKAIHIISDQGEGSSLCNPMFWSNGSTLDLSHYYLFSSIAEKRQIKVMDIDSKNKRGLVQPSNDDQSEFYKVCRGKYSFKGPKINFDPNGVWPMIPNPKLSKYPKDSNAYVKANDFNRVYTRLLKSLDRVFNGHPKELKDSMGIMYSLQVHLKKLLRTPIHPKGDPDVGPNAGPSFDFTPK